MYTSKTLFSLITEISRNQIFLPHIQRAFVWKEDQIIRLFDSLMRNYPIQTLLFWKTNEAIKARKFQNPIEWECDLHRLYDKEHSIEGCEKTFVLDGQQRLQSLYCIFNGGIQNESDKIIREAYVNIFESEISEEDQLIYHIKFSDKSPGDDWYKLRNLMNIDNQKKPKEIVRGVIKRIEESTGASLDKQKVDIAEDNMDQIVNILRQDGHFWIKELDGVANDFKYKKILEIFVRVNNGGTKLDAMDLMFASMKENWEDIEEKVEDIVEMLGETGLDFDKIFVLKSILCALGEGSAITVDKFEGKSGERLLDKIQAEWENIENAFAALCDFISRDMILYSPSLVVTYNSFVPIFVYYYRTPKPNEIELPKLKSFFYKAQILKWFDKQTDVIVTNLSEKVIKAGNLFPYKEILKYFEDKGKSTSISENEINAKKHRPIVLNIIYTSMHATSPFNVRLKNNQPQIDHIYPQSKLKKIGIPTEDINSIGNFRYIGAIDNNRKRAELPASYFLRCKDNGIDIHKHLLVKQYSEKPESMQYKEEVYYEFLKKRIAKINKCIKETIIDA